MQARMLLGGAFCVMTGALLMGQAASAPATAPATTASSAPAENRRVISVQSMDELLKAIGPNRIVDLAPGSYKLSDAKRGVGVNYKWREAIDGEYELVIRNASNLTLRCSGKEPAHLQTAFVYANVLNFENCTRLEMVNLKIGHAAEKGQCIGGVIKAVSCAGMRIEKCDLYGSGTQGLDLQKSQQFAFIESTIEDCSNGIMTAEECEGLSFLKSTFKECEQYHGFDFTDCTQVDFTDCTVADNYVGYNVETSPLFKTNLSDGELAMHFWGGTIRHNAAAALVKVPEMLVVEKTTVEGNAWQAAPQIKKARGTRTSPASGSAVYTVDLGERSWEELSMKLYGSGDEAQRLRAANPQVKEPLWPDTKVRLPRE